MEEVLSRVRKDVMVAVIQDFIGLATVVVEFLLRRELDLCIAFVVRDFGDSKSTFAECRKLGSESREELAILDGAGKETKHRCSLSFRHAEKTIGVCRWPLDVMTFCSGLSIYVGDQLLPN